MFIAQILILVSLIGIGVIVLAKMPALLKLPAQPKEILPSSSFSSRVRLRMKSWPYSEYRGKILSRLEKLLRKIRILFLKIDTLFLFGIKKAREKSQLWRIKSKKKDSLTKEKELIGLISQNPQNPQPYQELGSLYLRRKNYRDAEQAFAQALKLKPDAPEIKEKLRKIKKLRMPG